MMQKGRVREMWANQEFLARSLWKGCGLLSWWCRSMQNPLIVLKRNRRIHKPVRGPASFSTNTQGLMLCKAAPTVAAWMCVVFLQGLGLGMRERLANMQCKLHIYTLGYLCGKLTLKGTSKTVTQWIQETPKHHSLSLTPVKTEWKWMENILNLETIVEV